MNNYSSYLIRHWVLLADNKDSRAHVFDIEHIQSGRRTRVSNLAQAQAWLEAVTAQSNAEEHISRKVGAS